jgi:hypothetical protein
MTEPTLCMNMRCIFCSGTSKINENNIIRTTEQPYKYIPYFVSFIKLSYTGHAKCPICLTDNEITKYPYNVYAYKKNIYDRQKYSEKLHILKNCTNEPFYDIL